MCQRKAVTGCKIVLQEIPGANRQRGIIPEIFHQWEIILNLLDKSFSAYRIFAEAVARLKTTALKQELSCSKM